MQPPSGAAPAPGAAERGNATSLRARLQRAITGAVVLALVLFAVPLAGAVAFTVHSAAMTALQRDATRAAALVPDNTVEVGGQVQVPAHPGRVRIAVYSVGGIRAAGEGPPFSRLAVAARDGREHGGREGGDYVSVVPVLSDGTVVGTVRAGTPVGDVVVRTLEWWAGLAALAVLVLAVTRRVGRRLASRVATPVEQMTLAARALGDGRFDIALPVWGLREADEAGTALQETARRLGATVRRERAFTRDVSHQLRTPLSGLLTGLEAALSDSGGRAGDAADRAALALALERARHLQTTIDDLLLVRRAGVAPAGCDVVAEARAALERHPLPAGRTAQLRTDAVPPAACAPAVVRQVLDVLLNNAIRHGGGEITVTVEQVGETVVVEVADDGAGFAVSAAPGTGLRLATDLAESAYGTLLVRRRSPRPRVALMVPATVEVPLADGLLT